MLKTRLLSALIMLPAALLCVWAGSPVFDVAVAAVSVVMALEWQAIVQPGYRTPGWIGAILAVFASLSATSLPGPALAVALLAPLPVYLAARRRSGAGWAALGGLYVALPCFALVWLRDAGGTAVLLWLLFIVWATDTGGYIFGKRIGGPKLAPRISPKKTWAGLGGGVLSAAAMGVIAAFLANRQALPTLLVLSILLAVVEQVSDLVESYVKRRFGVKDSGTIIPGHGGVLDRVDGLVLTAPLAAVFTALTGGGIAAW